MSKLRFIGPPVVLALAAGVVTMLVTSKPTARRVDNRTRAPLVEFMVAKQTSQAARVQGQGTVIPARQIDLQAEVGGRVVWVSPQLVPGGRFERGQPILRIDRRNYEMVVAQQEANVERARLELEVEQGRKRVAEREWKVMGRGKTGSQGRALALREPQLVFAQASLRAAEHALERAKLDLERTALRAPFNAIVLMRDADLGQVIGPQSKIAQLAGTDAYWVQMPVPSDHLACIEPDAQAAVRQKLGKRVTNRSGKVVQILGDLDPVGRMARVLVQIDTPLDAVKEADVPVLLNAFVDVEVTGKTFEGVIELPEIALRGDDTVWVLTRDNRLETRVVSIAWRTRDTLLIDDGITAGDRVITSALAAPAPGMLLRTSTSSATGDGRANGKRS